MKMKKYLSFLVIFVLSIVIFIPKVVDAANPFGLSEDFKTVGSAVADRSDMEEIMKIYEKEMEEQAAALEASSTLSSMFDVSPQGRYIYPSDYAGSWYEDGTYFIALTSFDQIQKYKDKLSEFDCVSYVLKERSLNQLEEIEDDMYELIKNDININCFYVDIVQNKIIYETSEPQKTATEKFYDIMSSSIVQLYENANIATKIDESLFEIIEGDEMIDQAYVFGGNEFSITYCGSDSASVGICGTIHDGNNDYEGFVTCGHGMTTSGPGADIYINRTLYYGQTFYTNYSDFAYGDWSVVRKQNDDLTQTNMVCSDSLGFLRNINGTMDGLSIGFSFMKYGYKGGYCTGTVEAVNLRVTDLNGVVIDGVSRAILKSGNSMKGDSGGPYYIGGFQGTNDCKFFGVHKGSSENGTKITFTPYICFKHFFTPKMEGDGITFPMQ